MTAPPPTAWRPPTWTAIWQPHPADGRKVWRFSIEDPGGTELWSLVTQICAEDDHPGSHPWRSLISIAAIPGSDWQHDGGRWVRAVWPVTPDAEGEILKWAAERPPP